MPETPQATPDTEITLKHSDYTLTVSPYGASLRGLTHRGRPVVTVYHGAAGKVGGQGDVLIPFPGRVAGGRYTFEGRTHQMTRNDKETPSAIHGFLRTQLWESAVAADGRSVKFQTDLTPDQHPGYPFALSVTVTYTVSDDGMTCHFAIKNSGTDTAPIAAGFHPYFAVSSPLINEDTLHLPFAARLEFKDLLPTGRVLPLDGTPDDFREPHPIGATVFNTCFLDPQRDADGCVRVRLSSPDGTALAVWMDEAFDYVVLYSGDPLPDSHRRRALAIEPMTCGSDAFNHPSWGLVSLAPARTFTGEWGVGAE